MTNPNELPLALIKTIIEMVPSIKLAEDMTGPVQVINGKPIEARIRKLTSNQLNATALEKELGGQTIALYKFYNAGKGLKAGQTYRVMDPHTLEFGVPIVAEVDTPDTFVLRYGVVE